MGLRMFEIAEAYRVWLDQVEEAGGEITPELEAVLASLERSIEAKVDSYAAMIRESEVEADAHRVEANRHQGIARRKEAMAERLKVNLKTAMQLMGYDKVRGTRFTASVVKNSQPSINWSFAEAIPEAFRRTKVELDKGLAHEAYKAGTLPEGFTVELGEHVRLT